MSRIEQALRKVAARDRGSTPAADEDVAAAVVPASAPEPPASPLPGPSLPPEPPVREVLPRAEGAPVMTKATGTVPGSAASPEPQGFPAAAAPAPPADPGLDEVYQAPPLKPASPLLTIARGEHDVINEEYNKLRALIVKLTKAETFRNTLMVTSAVSQEGKSVTASNLAIALAREYDHTVLLVDCDLRRPSIHQLFGIEPKVGLIQCLRDGLPVREALVKTGIGKLVLLPAGEVMKDPVELLASNQMKSFVHELKTRYPERYVIFDTPPVLPFADAQVLSAAMDGTIFVVREGHAKAQEVREAINTLHAGTILGVVYNDARLFPRKKRHYYYY